MTTDAGNSGAAAKGPAAAAAHKDTDYSFEPVPVTARKGILPLVFVMTGFTFTSSAMSVGAKMGTQADFPSFAIALLLGGLFLSVYTGSLAYISCRTGMSFDLLARHSFGRRGSRLPSLVIAMTQMGWFGVCTAMFALPVSEYLGCSPYIAAAASGACMTLTAYIGFKGLEILSYVAVPLILALGLWSLNLALGDAGGSLADIFRNSNGEPDLNLLTGMVIGCFISGGSSTPNFTRFARTSRIAVLSTVAGFGLGNSLMLLFGAAGGAITGKDDIFYVMIAQGLLLSGFLVLGANVWTTNDNALYSAGLGLSNIFSVRKKIMVLAAGVLGTASSFWLYEHMVSWLQFLGATLPAIGIIMILHYCRDRKEYQKTAENFRNWRFSAIIGTAAGLLSGIFIPLGNSSINSMAVAAAVWYVCQLWENRLAKGTA